MTIQLYTTADDPKTVSKSLSGVSTMTARATQPCDILHPNLILSGDSTVNAINANYVYIPDYARYYFIRKHTTDTAARIVLECDVDVLMSHQNIRNTSQRVIRSESVGKPSMIPDAQLPLMPYKDVRCILFDGSYFNIQGGATMNTFNFVMNVAGGGSGQEG